MKETYHTTKAIQGQREYCKRTGAPHFAPNNGRCWSCNNNIYAPITRKNNFTGKDYQTGITLDKATNRLVTGCPHCNRSYCD